MIFSLLLEKSEGKRMMIRVRNEVSVSVGISLTSNLSCVYKKQEFFDMTSNLMVK